MIPAKVNIPANVKSLSLISRVYPDSITGTLESLSNIVLDSSKNYYPLSAEALFAVSDELKNSPRYQVVKISGNYDSIENIHHPDTSIPWKKVREKCVIDSTDALLSLEYFNISDTIFINTAISGFCRINYIIFLKTLWKLYDPFNLKLDDFYTLSDTLRWTGYGYDYWDALTNFPYAEDMIINAFNSSGTKYAKRIAPYWADGINRFYFVTGNKKFRLAKKYVRNDKWLDAAELWKPLTDNRDKKIAARAAFNMALACEIQNRLDLAVVWINKSDSLNDNSATKKYMKVLKARLNVNSVLDTQLNQ
jgi:hypothetical protein